MKNIQGQILEITQAENMESALITLLKDYLDCKLFFLENENKRLEEKWKMTFSDFEEKSHRMPNGTSFEMDTEYMEWDSVITGIEYYTKVKKEWT